MQVRMKYLQNKWLGHLYFKVLFACVDDKVQATTRDRKKFKVLRIIVFHVKRVKRMRSSSRL